MAQEPGKIADGSNDPDPHRENKPVRALKFGFRFWVAIIALVTIVVIVGIGLIVQNPFADNHKKDPGAQAVVETRLGQGTPGVSAVAYSPDSKILASGFENGEIKLWDAFTYEVVTVLKEHDSYIFELVYSPNGKVLASSDSKGTVRLWDAARGTEIGVLQTDSDRGHEIAFSPDGKLLVSGEIQGGKIQLWDAETGKSVQILEGHIDEVNDILFSPDGDGLIFSGNRNVHLWNLVENRPDGILEQAGYTSRLLSVSPDGASLLSSGDAGIRLWDIQTGEPSVGFSVDRPTGLALSPDGKILASSSWNGSIKLWDVESGEELLTIEADAAGRLRVAFSPDGRALASGSENGTIRIWDWSKRVLDRPSTTTSANTGSLQETNSLFIGPENADKVQQLMRLGRGLLNQAIWSPKGDLFAVASSTGTWLYNAEAPADEPRLLGQEVLVSSLAFNPDGSLLATGEGYQLRIWEPYTGNNVYALSNFHGRPNAFAFSPDGSVLAYGCMNQEKANYSIQLWDVAAGTGRAMLGDYSDTRQSFAFSPDGKILASGSAAYDRPENGIEFWSVETGEKLAILEPDILVDSVAFSPDGLVLAAGIATGTKVQNGFIIDGFMVRVWNWKTGEKLMQLEGYDSDIENLAFSPNGEMLVSGSDSRGDAAHTLRFWDTATGNLINIVEYGGGPIAFSPDGATMVFKSDIYQARWWNIMERASVYEFEDYGASISSLSLSPDMKTLASGSTGNSSLRDNAVRLWDITTGSGKAVLEGHAGHVTTVAFSADGKLLASSSLDATVRVWDMSTLQTKETLSGFEKAAYAVAFDPDGKLLASGDQEGTITLWDVEKGERVGFLGYGSGSMKCLAFSPNGTLLASSGQGGMEVWDVATQSNVQNVTGHYFDVEFSQDNKHIFVAGEGVGVWDVEAGERLSLFVNNTSPSSAYFTWMLNARSLAISPDGRILAVGAKSVGGEVWLWNVVTGETLAVLTGHTSQVSSVAFSPDGKYIFSGSMDGTIRIWGVIN